MNDIDRIITESLSLDTIQDLVIDLVNIKDNLHDLIVKLFNSSDTSTVAENLLHSESIIRKSLVTLDQATDYVESTI